MTNPQLGEKDEWWVMATPVGQLFLAGDSDWLHAVGLPGSFDEEAMGLERRGTPDAVEETVRQLEAYFAGDLLAFSVPTQAFGTDFQLRVWHALTEIPYGSTESYGQLAARIGKPGASRAVGLANGRNPIPVVVPCHRVIGANGNLTGYGRGLGLLAMKRWLLEHEAETLRRAGGLGA